MGPAVDPFVETFFSTLVKLTAVTKRLVAQQAKLVSSILISNCSYHLKVLQTLFIASQDKNAYPRTCASNWLKILLEAHAEAKSHIEATHGTEFIEKILKKQIGDSNSAVREATREAYATYASIWPDRAQAYVVLSANFTDLYKASQVY